jgi:hypothetical protein
MFLEGIITLLMARWSAHFLEKQVKRGELVTKNKVSFVSLATM